MIEVTREVPTDPAHVFAVLADGWSYPLWVVGASHMRDVDEEWPATGSRIHHSVGAWPLVVEDITEVVAMEPERHLELRARVWPTGTARIVVDLEPTPGGTRVTMAEGPESGPARLVPHHVQLLLLGARNREALSRLGQIAVNREARAR